MAAVVSFPPGGAIAVLLCTQGPRMQHRSRPYPHPPIPCPGPRSPLGRAAAVRTRGGRRPRLDRLALLAAFALTLVAPAVVRAVPHVAFGLAPFYPYDVYRDGQKVVSSIPTSGEGILSFEADGTGTFNILPAGSPADAEAPAAITSLVVASHGSSTVTLQWTAPGDDGGVGAAHLYDLRYATSLITEGSFAVATPVMGEPSPSPSGSLQVCVVPGLDPGTTYYFALRTADELLNWSGLSNVVSAETDGVAPPPPPPPPGGDEIPPAVVGNLAVALATTTTLTVTWTAPGDDGNAGAATEYDLRRATFPVTDANFLSCTRVTTLSAPQNAGQTESVVVGGLQSGVTYYFALKSADEVPNWSPISNGASGTTTAPPPPPPPEDDIPPAYCADLSAGDPTPHSIDLSWTAPGDDGDQGVASQYDLRYATSTITEANFAAATPVTGLELPRAGGQVEGITIDDLEPSTTYYFAFKAADEVPNWSVLSNVAQARTLDLPPAPDLTPPSTVTSLALDSVTDTSVRITWTAPGDDGSTGQATTYDLRYSTQPIHSLNFAQATRIATGTPRAPGEVERVTVSDLVPETTYYVALKAADEVPNWSGLSNLPSARTLAGTPPPPPPPDTTPPAAVTDLAVTATSDSSATLRWTAPGDDGASGQATEYDLRFATFAITASNFESATRVTDLATPRVAGSTEVVSIAGLAPATVYWFALKTADEVANLSVLSNVPSGATAETAPPPPPPPGGDLIPPAATSDLAVIARTETAITLSWTAPGDDGASGTAQSYDLRSAAVEITEANWDAAAQVAAEPSPGSAGTVEFCTVSDLSPGETYFFALKSRDDAGNVSPLSNVVSAATQALPAPDDVLPPAAVTTLAALEVGPRSATLTWIAPGDDGADGTAAAYDLRRSSTPISAATWPLADPVPLAAPPRAGGEPETIRVDGLPPRTRLYFALQSRDEADNLSPLSNLLEVTTSAIPDTLPPETILDLAVIDSSETSVTLGWTAPADLLPEGAEGDGRPSSYAVRRQAGGDEPFDWDAAVPCGEPAVQTPGTWVSFEVSELQPATSYRFAVRSRDEAGNWNEPSPSITGVTRVVTSPPPPPPPPPPAEGATLAPATVTTLVGYAAGPTTLRLTWQAVGDDGMSGAAARYQVRWSDLPVTPERWAALDSLAGLPAPGSSGSWESYDWPAREPGLTYHLAIRAIDEAGNAGPISDDAVVTMPLPGDEAPPAPPGAPRLETEGEAIVVSWDPSPDADVVGYRLLRRRGDRVEPQVLIELVRGLTWRDAAVVPSLLYGYCLHAVDASGNVSPETGEVLILAPRGEEAPDYSPLVRRVDILDATPPTPAEDAVRLRWQAELGYPLIGYRVYREAVDPSAEAGKSLDGAKASEGGEGSSGFRLLTEEPVIGDGLLQFEDAPPPPVGWYRYWIEVLGRAAEEPAAADSILIEWLDPILVEIRAVTPMPIRLGPNPTPGPLRIVYSREAAGEARLLVFDIGGRRVAEWTREDPAGRNTWEIDCLDLPDGRILGNGVYYLRLAAGGADRSSRFVVWRGK